MLRPLEHVVRMSHDDTLLMFTRLEYIITFDTRIHHIKEVRMLKQERSFWYQCIKHPQPIEAGYEPETYADQSCVRPNDVIFFQIVYCIYENMVSLNSCFSKQSA